MIKSVVGSFVCVFICYLNYVYADAGSEFDTCLTPEKQNGKCVIINDCPQLLNLLKKRPLPPEHEERLKKSSCGFVGIHPKVCCPWKNHPKDFKEKDISPTTQEPSVVATVPPITEPPLSDLLPGENDCGYYLEDLVLFGEKTQLDAYPWMALLQYETPNGKRFTCGGVLINNRYVLTAAHCISGKEIDPLTWKLLGVRLGEYNVDTDPDCDSAVFALTDCCCTTRVIDLQLEKVIVHEQYHPEDDSQHNDIALLRLDEEVEFTDFVRPICLQPLVHLKNNSRPGSSGVIGGWGFTTLRSHSNIKQSAPVEIRENAECESVYTDQGLQLGDSQICAFAATGRNTCPGDSGGALMNNIRGPNSPLRYYAVGIMSFAQPICGLSEFPVVYTKVENYIPWIVKNLHP